jgi:hypothetical protein
VTAEPDAYAIWGDWNLDQFKVELARWRSTAHPPDDVHATIDQWWRRLKQPMEWANAPYASQDLDPQGNLRWMWVPAGSWIDDAGAYLRTQCWFRAFEVERPPRLVCAEFRAVQSLSPSEVDRADGMG